MNVSRFMNLATILSLDLESQYNLVQGLPRLIWVPPGGGVISPRHTSGGYSG